MAPRPSHLWNNQDLDSSLSPMDEMGTEETGQCYNGDVSSYNDSLVSDASRAISEMYESFDVKDISKEEFTFMLANAPPLELQSMFESHGDPLNAAESRRKGHAITPSSASGSSSSSEASSLDRPSGVFDASEELDPELSVTLSEIGHFIRKHPFNKDPLAIHTVSERRAYTRAVYDYARALHLSSSYAEEVVKEVRRIYKKNRHIARVISWVDVAAKAGRTMEDELERIRTENDWDTDELEGNFPDEDEELETSFGTEIDDSADILQGTLMSDLIDGVADKMSHLDPSDDQVEQPGSEAEISKTTGKKKKKRAKKRRRESVTDDGQANRSKKTAKRTKESKVVADDVGVSRPRSEALNTNLPAAEGATESVEPSRSDRISEKKPPAKRKRKRTVRGRRKEDGMLGALSADQNDSPEAVGSRAGTAEHSPKQSDKLRAFPAGSQGDTNPEEGQDISTGNARSTGFKSQARKGRGALERALERKQVQSSTKPRIGQSPAVGGGTRGVRKQGFLLPSDTPYVAGVEGVAVNNEEQAMTDQLAGRKDFEGGRNDDNFSVVITHSSPPNSTTFEDDPEGHAADDSGHADLDIHQQCPETVAPEVSELQSTPSKARKPTTPLTSPYFKTKLHLKSTSRRTLRISASCIPFPSISQENFGLIQEKLAHDPFKLLVAVTFLNRTRGIHAIPVFHSLMDRYPTPTDLAAADEGEVASHIRHLGLQNIRARRYIQLAQAWVEDPPVIGRRHRKLHYPNKGDGKDIKPGEIIDDEDERTGAWEIAHLPTTGPYAIDSWRIFCRDELRGMLAGAADEDKEDTGFEPEWKRVVPLDKELRAYLKWRWLKEGWDWDPGTGRKVRASQELLERAERGELDMEGAVESKCENNEPCTSVDMLAEVSPSSR